MRTIAAGLTFTVLAAASGVLAQENYSTWTSYKNIVLNTKAGGAGVGANVLNYPVLVRLDSTSADVFAQAGAGGASLRFAKPSGLDKRPYHIESWDATAKKAAIWVLLDTVRGNDSASAMRMYWGKTGAVDSSKSARVFDTTFGYKAVFHFNEASGDVFNATGDTITGVNVGTTSTGGIAGPARNFGGTNAVNTNSTTDRQFINLNNPAPLSFTGRTTFSAWVRWVNVVGTGGTSVYRTILNRDGSAPSGETFLRIGQGAGTALNQSQYATGKYTAGTGAKDILGLSPTPASAYPDSAQWIHLAGAYDSTSPTSRVWRLYRNGVQIGASAHDTLAGVTTGATLWRIGRGTGTQNARWFSGDLDEIRVSNVTRDSNFLKLEYEIQKPGTAAVKVGATQGGSTPPSNLVYSPDSLSVVVGIAVNLTPTFVGTVDSFTIAPALPDSLVLNKTTGAITGRAKAAKALTSYVITATNASGSVKDTVRMVVMATSSLAELARLQGEALSLTARASGGGYRFQVTGVESGAIRLSVINMAGRELWTRLEKAEKGGDRGFEWNGASRGGAALGTGMYAIRLAVLDNQGRTVATREMKLPLLR